MTTNPSLDGRGPRAKARGFTLIEIMIVVAILGVLAAIAIPQYQQYVIKARRADAKGAVLDMAARQERYFSINNAYATTALQLGYASLPSDVNSSGKSYYQLQLPTVTTSPAGFTAVAIPQGVQQKDTECYSYQIDNLGAQSQANSGGTKFTTTTCW